MYSFFDQNLCSVKDSMRTVLSVRNRCAKCYRSMMLFEPAFSNIPFLLIFCSLQLFLPMQTNHVSADILLLLQRTLKFYPQSGSYCSDHVQNHGNISFCY